MMMKSLFVLLMLAGCQGCYIISHDEVTPVGDTFDGTWSEEVAQAAQEWTAVGCTITVTPDGIPTGLLSSGDPLWENGADASEGVNHLWGYYTGGDDPRIFIRDSLSPEARHKMLLHEMGHMLGYSHRDWGIMQPRVKQDYVTAADCQ